MLSRLPIFHFPSLPLYYRRAASRTDVLGRPDALKPDVMLLSIIAGVPMKASADRARRSPSALHCALSAVFAGAVRALP